MCKLAHAFRWECRYKGLKLAQGCLSHLYVARGRSCVLALHDEAADPEQRRENERHYCMQTTRINPSNTAHFAMPLAAKATLVNNQRGALSPLTSNILPSGSLVDSCLPADVKSSSCNVLELDSSCLKPAQAANPPDGAPAPFILVATKRRSLFLLPSATTPALFASPPSSRTTPRRPAGRAAEVAG